MSLPSCAALMAGGPEVVREGVGAGHREGDEPVRLAGADAAQQAGVGPAARREPQLALGAHHGPARGGPEHAVDVDLEAPPQQGHLQPAHARPLRAHRQGDAGRGPGPARACAEARDQARVGDAGRGQPDPALRGPHRPARLRAVAAVDRDGHARADEHALQGADPRPVGAHSQLHGAPRGGRPGEVADRDPQPPEERPVDDAVDAQPHALLESCHGEAGLGAEAAVGPHLQAALAQLPLQRAHGRAVRSDGQHPGLGEGRRPRGRSRGEPPGEQGERRGEGDECRAEGRGHDRLSDFAGRGQAPAARGCGPGPAGRWTTSPRERRIVTKWLFRLALVLIPMVLKRMRRRQSA